LLGAVEAALSVYLQHFARSLGSREQLAIAEFAEALKSKIYYLNKKKKQQILYF
jgi:chaperonin GroEL (HSP60 family)